jgi:hypothetical protein
MDLALWPTGRGLSESDASRRTIFRRTATTQRHQADRLLTDDPREWPPDRLQWRGAMSSGRYPSKEKCRNPTKIRIVYHHAHGLSRQYAASSGIHLRCSLIKWPGPEIALLQVQLVSPQAGVQAGLEGSDRRAADMLERDQTEICTEHSKGNLAPWKDSRTTPSKPWYRKGWPVATVGSSCITILAMVIHTLGSMSAASVHGRLYPDGSLEYSCSHINSECPPVFAPPPSGTAAPPNINEGVEPSSRPRIERAPKRSRVRPP